MSADKPNPRGWPLVRQTTVATIARKAGVAAALGAVAAVTQACGGSGASGTAGLTPSSPPPASASATSSGPVTHTAQVFMPGMKVTVPTSGWTVYEDHPGEFNLASPPGTTAGTNIHFWLDPRASTPHDRPIPTVEENAGGADRVAEEQSRLRRVGSGESADRARDRGGTRGPGRLGHRAAFRSRLSRPMPGLLCMAPLRLRLRNSPGRADPALFRITWHRREHPHTRHLDRHAKREDFLRRDPRSRKDHR